jgi:hypothetical protein
MIFYHWQHDHHAAMFGVQPLVLDHGLNLNPLFRERGLINLIDDYPADKATLMRVGAAGKPERVWDKQQWGLGGAALLDQIKKGDLWLNLRHTQAVDRRFRDLLDGIYEEIADLVPGFPKTFKRICGVLISSPRTVVPYHFDTTGQNLWQIKGTKRIWLYPPEPPFVHTEDIERVTLLRDETSIRYEPWFDDHAKRFDLVPGTMLHWPLNWPHRIETGDELSVSLTTEFFTPEIQRHVRAHSGNGVLRRLGMKAPAMTTTGPAYYAKFGAFAAAKATGMVGRWRRATEGKPA